MVSESEPPGPVRDRVTVKVPAPYVWLGFVAVDVVPSPKLHRREVIEPVEASVNATSSGAKP